MSNVNTRITVFCLFLVVVFSSFSSIHADQTAPELPGLFSDLESATDPSEAKRIESLIWQHWFEAPDEESARLMSEISQAIAGSDLKIALILCKQLVESHPKFAEAWNRRATIHYMLGNNAESVADIRQTIALEPRHFGAISGLGLIFIRSNDFEAALEAFEKVLAISPASINAQRSAARVRLELGREI